MAAAHWDAARIGYSRPDDRAIGQAGLAHPLFRHPQWQRRREAATVPAVNRPLRIVVTCTSRKVGTRPDSPSLAVVRGRDVGDRLAEWRSLLGSADGARPAWDVYAGEHWQAVQNLCREVERRGWSPEVFVCSAGYGLIRAERRIVPYRATFAPGQPESVSHPSEPRDETNRVWWNGLVKGRRIGRLSGLVASDPFTPMLVAVSDIYLRAIRDDLEAAIRLIGCPERMLIVSGGASGSGDPIAARGIAPPGTLRRLLGGTLTSLNVRVAAVCLSHFRNGMFNRDKLADRLGDMAATVPAGEFTCGVQMSDGEVIDFIRSRLDQGQSRSSLHRTLRDEGWACEQRRFARLYQYAAEDAVQ